MKIEDAVKRYPVILTDGAVLERLRRERTMELDPHILHAGLIYDDIGRRVVAGIYRQYIEVALKFDLPIIVLAPTWRANPERIGQSNFRDKEDINGDCVRFLHSIRREYPGHEKKIYVGAVMACRGDSYRPDEAISREEARRFHAPQARALADAGADLITPCTLPAVSEASGIAAALSETGCAHGISLVVRPDGRVLDGASLHDAIHRIDSETDPKPLFYGVNCVHPSAFAKALEREINQTPLVRERLFFFQANTSAKSPEELDNLEYLDAMDPGEYGEAMAALHERFGVKILGGCCGSDHRHIEEIAARVAATR
ncbi:MAG: homocysteine S-methyltransferase family protein [Desulfobacterales bacterium]|nr:homocysteine S-methyltransferase family protein [Desulfobacterales bacterium]